MPNPAAPDPRDRFTGRAEVYQRYRPRYPREVLGWLRADCGLEPRHAVADIGAGTGILSELFLQNGNRVLAVEPNAQMRALALEIHGGNPQFDLVEGAAERTTLPDGAADFITAGQAFHWFRVPETRREFARILRTGGWVVVLWNDLLGEASEFLRDYESLLREFGTDYLEVRGRAVPEEQLQMFLGETTFRKFTTRHSQRLDREGLEGRLLSSSFTPGPEHPRHGQMLERLGEIFAKHQQNGAVAMEYELRAFAGQLR